MERHFSDCRVQIHGCLCEVRRYRWMLVVNSVVFVLEALGVVRSGSVSLFSDAGHVLSDTAAVLVALLVAYVAYRRREDDHAARRAGAYVHGALLMGAAVWTLIEAVERAEHPREVVTTQLMWFAAAGLVGNYVSLRILRFGAPNITRAGMHWHVWSDLFQSVAVLVAGGLIILTGLDVIDAIAAFVLSFYMGWGAFQLLRLGNGGHVHH